MYQPNFNNKTTRRRCLQIIQWVEKNIGSETKTLHSKILRSKTVFGTGSLGAYLQKCLLITVNPGYKPGETSKKYRVNINYLNKLRSKLDLPESTLKDHRIEKLHDLVSEGNFEYNDNGLRWYNSGQYLERSKKSLFWSQHNYDYDYDIDCCAPTLLMQRAEKLNPKMKSLDYIKFYLNNKQLVREELAIKYNLSIAQVKQIINALFQGGVLNSYSGNKILGYVNNNHWKMRSLSNDPYVIELILDIKRMWKSIRPDINTGYEYQGDQRRLKRITGKHKSEYYQKLERQVMSVVWKQLKKKDVVHFREHDGFRSKSFVVPEELEDQVFAATGYKIKFKWTKVEVND